MSNSNVINEKKKALLAYKEKLLDDIKACERSIDEFRANHKNISFYDDADSSDSDDDYLSTVNLGPTTTQLKLQQAMLKTCLQATQELTSLTVLESEINVLVEDPKLEGERPVTEAGTWREVTAECRIDLIPFTITFFMHTPDRKFAPPSYRGLRVVPVKSSHELELSKSVLHSLKTPSDAVEVLRRYAAGYRSRRTTLARLANKYGNALFMEPHAEGGFVLKCADLLEVSWRLENKWSPVAPFHHRMKFDLEYMDESYIKIITQTHKQLLDPAIQTDERTLLLAKIITTCLEARGPIDQESDIESRTTDRNLDVQDTDGVNQIRDSEVMAPPKSLPKKVKKSTNSLPPAQKRVMDDGNGDDGAKKVKTDISNDTNKKIMTDNNVRKSKINDVDQTSGKKRKLDENKVASGKNVTEAGNTEDVSAKIGKKTSNKEKGKPKNVKETIIASGDTKNVKETVSKDKTKPKNVKESNIDIGYIKPTNEKAKNDKDGNTDSNSKTMKQSISADTNPKENTKNKTENMVKDKEVKAKNTKESANSENNAKLKTKIAKKSNSNQNNDKIADQDKTDAKSKAKTVKNPTNSNNDKNTNAKPKNVNPKEIDNTKTKSNEKIKPKNLANTKNKDDLGPKEKNTAKDIEQPKTKLSEKNINVATSKSVINHEKNINIANTKNIANHKKTTETTKNVASKVTEKNALNYRNRDKISQISNLNSKAISDKKITDKKSSNVKENIPKNNILVKNKQVLNSKNVIKNTVKNIASHRSSIKMQNGQKNIKSGNTKASSGNIDKENGGKISKIPQKKISPVRQSSLKQNLLRMSPRNTIFKSLSQDTFKQKMVKSTNIPRLAKKPAPKNM